jgi:hypothetical protein
MTSCFLIINPMVMKGGPRKLLISKEIRFSKKYDKKLNYAESMYKGNTKGDKWQKSFPSRIKEIIS